MAEKTTEFKCPGCGVSIGDAECHLMHSLCGELWHPPCVQRSIKKATDEAIAVFCNDGTQYHRPEQFLQTIAAAVSEVLLADRCRVCGKAKEEADDWFGEAFCCDCWPAQIHTDKSEARLVEEGLA